jgi:hypothetical protein
MDRIITVDPMLRVASPTGWKVLPKFLASEKAFNQLIIGSLARLSGREKIW